MQIIGFNFTKISAERKKSPSGKVEIKSNIDIDSILPEKVEVIKDKDVLKFNFQFNIDYSPELASIKIAGSVAAIFEKEKSKEIQKKWKNKKISDDVRMLVFNAILAKCSLKSLQLEEDFGLPMHIPFPRLSPQQNQSYVQ